MSTERVRLRPGDSTILPKIIEGISPEVTLTEQSTGVLLTVTTKSGSKSALIPKGEQGIQGPQGIQGIQGIQGPAGDDYQLTEEDVEAIKAAYDDIKEAAEDAAEAAAGSAEDAAGSAETAAEKEELATAAAEAAANYEDSASDHADDAQTYAGNASTSAGQAATSAEGALASSRDSEAWAVGKRAGVDVSSSDSTYHNNAKYYSAQSESSATGAAGSASDASGSATSAATAALKSEGFAVGEQNGSAVASGSPYYHNNAEYYADQAASSASSVASSATQIATNTQDISDLKSAISEDGTIERFLYKKGYCLNSSGVETANTDYSIYKVPVSKGDLITISTKADANYWGTLNTGVVHQFHISTGFVAVPAADGSTYGRFVSSARKTVAVAPADVDYFYLSILTSQKSNIILRINNDGSYIYLRTGIKRSNVKSLGSILSGFFSEYYPRGDGTFRRLSGYNVYPVAIKSGDVINCENLTSGLTYYGFFLTKNSLSCSQIQSTYRATEDGIAFLFGDYYISPNDSITIEDLQFHGTNGVAFGTSITYRAQTTYGYLQFLPALSGINFDNQGIGGSGITGSMLTAIQEYTGYSNKRVVIIEGFVNDWYNGNTLGTYTDTEDDTACGCLRTAINYIMSQNPNLQIFVVLDHYGKVNNGANCSSTAKNANNLTQYDYYEEMAKVCESLGVVAIKLYETSGICENTPQYITDNIHPTKLGARQTAYCIWYAMRVFPLSQTE